MSSENDQQHHEAGSLLLHYCSQACLKDTYLWRLNCAPSRILLLYLDLGWRT